MAPRTRVKERAEEQSSAMTIDQQAVIRMVANDLHRLNQSVMKAVEAGVSVELVRSARHHGGSGNWGDLLIPVSSRNRRSPDRSPTGLREATGDPAAQRGWVADLSRRVGILASVAAPLQCRRLRPAVAAASPGHQARFALTTAGKPSTIEATSSGLFRSFENGFPIMSNWNFGSDSGNSGLPERRRYRATARRPILAAVLVVGKSNITRVVVSKIVERSGLATGRRVAGETRSARSPAAARHRHPRRRRRQLRLQPPLSLSLSDQRRMSGRNVPRVILLSTRTGTPETLSLGPMVDAVVAKPITPENLQPVVDRLLRGRAR